MEELEGDEAVMLTVEHLQTWWCYLKDAFATKLQKKVCLVDALQVHNWWHAGRDDKAHQLVMER